MLDENGLVKTWNKGAQRIKGFELADVIGKPISQFFTPEDIAAHEPERALTRSRQPRPV